MFSWIKQGWTPLVLVAVALCLVALASRSFTAKADGLENNNGSEENLVPTQVQGTLQTKVNNPVAYNAVFKGPEGSVELQSKQTEIDGKKSPKASASATQSHSRSASEVVTTANSIQTSLIVNGKRLDFSEDLNQGTLSFSPHGQALTEEDLVAINGAYYGFERSMDSLMDTAVEKSKNTPADTNLYDEHPRLDPDNPLDPQDDLMLRALIFLSEAPVGVKLQGHEVSQPKPREYTGLTVEGDVLNMDSSPTTSVNTKSVRLAEAACNKAENVLSLNLVACTNPNDDKLYVHTCWTGTRTTHHDDGEHCFKSFQERSGPSAPSCMGRCGKGCGSSNGLGIYTKDCLDHDDVVEHVGYLAPRAQDEFKWTLNDATYGENNPSQKCRR